MGGRGSGENPNSQKNLTHRGTAEGRAAVRATILLSKALKRKLVEVDPADENKRTYAEVLAERWVLIAKGATPGTASWKAMEALRDTTEGRPAQFVDMTVTNKTPEEQVSSILESLQALSTPERVN